MCNNTNNVLRNNMERNIFQFINCEALCKNNIHKYLPVNICITIFVTSEYNHTYYFCIKKYDALNCDFNRFDICRRSQSG